MIIIIQQIYSKVTKKEDLLLFFGYKIVISKIKNIHIWMTVKAANDNINLFG